MPMAATDKTKRVAPKRKVLPGELLFHFVHLVFTRDSSPEAQDRDRREEAEDDQESLHVSLAASSSEQLRQLTKRTG